MARLIEAYALKKAILAEPWKDQNNAVRLTVDYINIIIDEQPTVDAVEVVRCKDCKHWLKDVPGCTDAIGRCRFGNYMVGAAGYCVYGERKTNEAD
jgi:hypothetical protein